MSAFLDSPTVNDPPLVRRLGKELPSFTFCLLLFFLGCSFVFFDKIGGWMYRLILFLLTFISLLRRRERKGKSKYDDDDIRGRMRKEMAVA